MSDVQSQIELVQIDIARASAALAKAVRERKAAKSDDPIDATFEAAVVAAREALIAAEIKLRTLYESKGD
jgi:hypothetical protein